MYTFWISVVFLYNTGTMDRLSVGHKSNVMLCLLVETLQRDSPSKQKILIFNDLYSHMWTHAKNIPRNSLYLCIYIVCIHAREIYCNFTTCCKISILLFKRHCVFHNFIFICSNNNLPVSAAFLVWPFYPPNGDVQDYCYISSHSRTHTKHSVGLLWTRDQPVAEKIIRVS